jgi:hypothetical protein
MTTILVINALSSLLASLGIAGWWVRRRRRAAAAVRPLYVRASPDA